MPKYEQCNSMHKVEIGLTCSLPDPKLYSPLAPLTQLPHYPTNPLH